MLVHIYIICLYVNKMWENKSRKVSYRFTDQVEGMLQYLKSFLRPWLLVLVWVNKKSLSSVISLNVIIAALHTDTQNTKNILNQ